MSIESQVLELAKDTTAPRRCLSCGGLFKSLSPANRQCARCAERNSKKMYRQPISLKMAGCKERATA